MTGVRNEPSWCVKADHDWPLQHVSRQLRAGMPGRFGGGGEVTAYLRSDDTGQTVLAVNAAHMTSETVDLTLDEARRHRNHLDVLIRLAEQGDQSCREQR